ncbi:hypothetical protein BO71DRAFT_18794 [Aspergillus ellipticus CBS 707.79]|uniref:Chromosome segregation protein BIR1 n=1 Tax=Aspergillus ellipticus CBS 707.79 TaxID=1448320 RepID=A0A319DEQ6_9EURO|nr:hypothetical protein BO71DRAFT_18794 [Aspergillus ellipticus CBS 707.79]
MIHRMETFAARLASFDRVLYPDKRRSSSAPANPVAWPHSRPSPAELAHAGFFYNPYATNPDNTTCFLCQRALDGWEEDDNPITEHLKHTKDCGWAIMMDIQQHSSNPAEIEDPTGEWIAQARQATFGESWPHDGKRGWVCQSEKMVEGGWYFCPNEESNDLATCPYCKLSLDGWEPKDDPFDEHYRRSSDCSFFFFAKPAGKKGKGSRSKKARVSKVSRLSTQSTVSEAPVPELDDMVDQSALSQSTTKTKSSKKSSKSKSKGSKSKKEEPVDTASQMDIDTDVQPEPTKAKRTRGKKRTSDEVQRDDAELVDEPVEKLEPRAKKKSKKSHDSTQEHDSYLEAAKEDEPMEEAPPEEKPKKSRGTSKKKTTSKSRKISTESTTSKAPSASEVPAHSELETAVEADLDLDQPEVEEPIEAPPPKLKKSKSKKKAKAAPEPPNDITEHSTEAEPQIEATQEPEHLPEPEPPVEEEQTRRMGKRQSARVSEKDARSSEKRPRISEEKPKTSKGKPRASEEEPRASAQRARASEQSSQQSPRESPEPVARPERESKAKEVVQHHESFVSVEIPAPVSKPKADVDQTDKDAKKMVKRKASSEKQRKSKQADQEDEEEEQEEVVVSPEEQASTKIEAASSPKDEEPESPQVEREKTQEQTPEPQSARRRSSRVPPKTAERYSDIPKEKQFAKSLADTRNSQASAVLDDDSQPDEEPEAAPVSPLPSPSKSTSLSPQSSDAENQPPSLKPTFKPSVSRPQFSSPSKAVRIPLVTSTPSPSKRGPNTGSLNTSHPWTPIDIDGVVVAGASDKENIDFNTILSSAKADLTSPEKKMSVEEWIQWNAKNGEEKLKRECERLVSQFEREGARAMRVLEGIECID